MVAGDDSIAARRPTPSHPPYALMIAEAIRSLGERRGSTETSISEYIRGNFEGLPWGHDRLLPYYLRKLTCDGEFVEGDGALYRIAQDDDGGGAAEEEGPDSFLALGEAQLLIEKRGVHGEDDLEALNRAVPAAREAETGGGDGDQAIAIDDGDNDDAAAVEPEPPTTGPLQGETKRTESVEAVANVDDDDDAAEEPEPPPLQAEGWKDTHSSKDGSKDDVAVADPLQRETKHTVDVELVANGDAAVAVAATTAEEPAAPPLSTGGCAENKSSEVVAEDLLLSHRVLPVSEGENVDGDATQTLESITHEYDGAEEPVPPLAKDCTEFVESHNFEDGSNNEERNIENVSIEPLQSIVLTQSQPETGGIENVEAIANVNDDDDEGVPIACEGDLFMEVQSLAIFLGPRNKLESPNCNGGNSKLAHELSQMSLIEPQEAESEEKKNHGAEGSESKPRRRGRPPKKRRTHSSSTGNSAMIVAQDGDLGRIHNSIVVTKPICPGGDVVVEPLQAVVPHQELRNVNCTEKDLTLVQSEPQKSVPKRRGRPPKRKLDATDSSKKVMVLDGDVEPIQVVDPSSFGTNDNVVNLLVPEKTSRNRDVRSKMNYDDDDEGVPIACEGDLFMEVQSQAIFPGPRNKLESPNCNGGNSELAHELSRKSLIGPQEAQSEVKNNHDGEGSESKPRRRGRPPKQRRTHNSSIGSSTVIVAQDCDLGRIQNSIVVREPICPGGDVADCVEKALTLVQSEPQKSVPKRRGRPPKRLR